MAGFAKGSGLAKGPGLANQQLRQKGTVFKFERDPGENHDKATKPRTMLRHAHKTQERRFNHHDGGYETDANSDPCHSCREQRSTHGWNRRLGVFIILVRSTNFSDDSISASCLDWMLGLE